jgi:hypothetical protein
MARNSGAVVVSALWTEPIHTLLRAPESVSRDSTRTFTSAVSAWKINSKMIYGEVLILYGQSSV